jgi:hypothetical protein
MIRVALVAALVGSALGAAGVLAAGENTPAVPVARTTAAPSARATPSPLPERNARILEQVDDPKGGLPWAIRAFESGYRTRKGKPRTTTCYQLGRLRAATLGWVDAAGTFKAEPAGGQCASTAQLHLTGVLSQRVTTVTADARPNETVTWGIAEAGVTQLTFNDEPPVTPAPEFLNIKLGDAPLIERTRVEHRDGTTKDLDPFGTYPGERIVPGSQTVAAFAPDPAGGAPWAFMKLKGVNGSTCFGTPGRLVGSHLGTIDHDYDVLMIDPFELHANCRRTPPTRAYPMRLDALVGGAEPSADGRNQLRVIDGRIVYFGTVHPDVATVTITTPRDVRTLVPTKDHAIIAVYAGLFPGGKATATAHLKDGSEVTRALHVE